MSTTKKGMSLSAAVEAFKKGSDARNGRLTDKAILKDIDFQIKANQDKADELQEGLTERVEEFESDFNEKLLNEIINNPGSIKSSSDRKEFAGAYTMKFARTLKSEDEKVSVIKEQISELLTKVKFLEDLKKRVSNITIEVEEE